VKTKDCIAFKVFVCRGRPDPRLTPCRIGDAGHDCRARMRELAILNYIAEQRKG